MPPSHAEPLASRILLGPALRSQPDRRLVKLVREGYETAFEEIVRRYRKPLDRFAAAIVGNRAEDDGRGYGGSGSDTDPSGGDGDSSGAREDTSGEDDSDEASRAGQGRNDSSGNQGRGRGRGGHSGGEDPTEDHSGEGNSGESHSGRHGSGGGDDD